MSTRLALLLVDAHSLDRRALVRFVETEGLPYDVVSVGSLAEAGTQLARRAFDVAVIDQRLGDGVGIDLLPNLLGTPAIILTRPGDETIAAQAGGPARTASSSAIRAAATSSSSRPASRPSWRAASPRSPRRPAPRKPSMPAATFSASSR